MSDVKTEEDDWAMFKEVGMRELKLSEIEKLYTTIGIISQNRNASVRLAMHNITGDRVAVKILNKSQLREQHKKILLLREISTLRLLGDCKNITELYDVIDSGDRIWVIMEYASGGELFDFVKAKAPLSNSTARDVFRPLVKVVAYMHSLNLVHRDLKLENVLLDHKGHLKLADFGFSRYYDPKDGLVESVCGTPQYSPPEIIKAIPHNPIYADSWSLGVILYVELCGEFPFKGLSIPELLQNIVKAELRIPPIPSELATDLLKRLLNPDPNERLSAAEIMKHPWINKNKVPRPPKKDYSARLNRVAMQEVKNLGIVKDGQEDNLDVDQMISYRLIRRKYQIGATPLPNAGRPASRSDFHPSSQQIPVKQQPIPNLPFLRSTNYSMGMPSSVVKERFNCLDSFLVTTRVQCRTPSCSHRKSQNKIPRFVRDIRKFQTMRFMTLLKSEPDLPIMNCQHTTLDQPEVLKQKLFSFMQKEGNIDIINEHDFSLFCKVSGQHEIYFSLMVGCVHAGFGLIGYTLKKIRGDQSTFDGFECKLSEYLGY